MSQKSPLLRKKLRKLEQIPCSRNVEKNVFLCIELADCFYKSLYKFIEKLTEDTENFVLKENTERAIMIHLLGRMIAESLHVFDEIGINNGLMTLLKTIGDYLECYRKEYRISSCTIDNDLLLRMLRKYRIL